MRIGIAGVGVVGGALRRHFNRHGKRDLKLYDPGQGFFDCLGDCELIFICVPAPTKTDGRKYYQDISIVEKVAREAIHDGFSGQFIVRSTLMAGTCDRLTAALDRRFISMPEFLTERYADADMKKLSVAIGGECPELNKYFNVKYHGKNHELEFAKLAHNSFCAIKVHFFNVVKIYCEQNNLDFEMVKKVADLTGFVGIETHAQVPGHDSMYGYGGSCLPKDIKLFSECVKHISGVPMLVDIENGKIRK